MPAITFKKSMSFLMCPQCIATKSGSKWSYPSPNNLTQFIESSIIKTVKESINLQKYDEIISINPVFSLEEPSKEIEFSMTIKRSPNASESYIETIESSIPLELQLCPRCTRAKSGSYEAILQVRGAKGNLSPEERENILSLIENTLKNRFKESPQSIVSKIVQKNEGIDLYFVSSNSAISIASSLRDSAAALIKTSSKLVGLDKSTSKRQYRVYISARIPHFRVGDFIKLDDSFYEIHTIGGGKIILYNLKTKTHRSLLVNNLWTQISNRQKKEEYLYPKEDYLHSYLVIAETPDSLQIMNLETYEIYEVQKAIDKKIESGDTIKGFQVNDNVFLLEN
jgi:nonsense-mediated mRNA decay protein 3